MRLFLLCMCLVFCLQSQAEMACKLRSGHEGELLVVQYKGFLEGSFQEQKHKFNDILHVRLEEPNIFEVMPDSVSVSARTAKVCVSRIYGPHLVEELLKRAEFVLGNEDILIDATN